jgi:hypothetical protein
MYATLLAHDPNNPHAEEQGEQEQSRQRQPGAMLGQLCSSLHRLKDVDNQGMISPTTLSPLPCTNTQLRNRRWLFHLRRFVSQETRLAQATIRTLRR